MPSGGGLKSLLQAVAQREEPGSFRGSVPACRFRGIRKRRRLPLKEADASGAAIAEEVRQKGSSSSVIGAGSAAAAGVAAVAFAAGFGAACPGTGNGVCPSI